MLQTFIYLVGDVDPRPVPQEDLKFAQQCIEFFVGRILYINPGSKVPICFHIILHVVRQLLVLGCHYGIVTAYPYENGCRFTKRFLNAGNCKAEQFRNRIMEVDKYLFARDDNDKIVRDADGEPACGWGPTQESKEKFPSGVNYHYQKSRNRQNLIFPTFLLSTAIADSFCLMKCPREISRDKRCVFRVTDIQVRRTSEKVFLLGHIYTVKKSLYKEPEDSTRQDVFSFSGKSEFVSAFPADHVRGKLYAIPRFSSFPNSLREVSVEDCGRDFEKVNDWVGIRLRHAHVDISRDEMTSMY
jgi:hypothetical protein